MQNVSIEEKNKTIVTVNRKVQSYKQEYITIHHLLFRFDYLQNEIGSTHAYYKATYKLSSK